MFVAPLGLHSALHPHNPRFVVELHAEQIFDQNLFAVVAGLRYLVPCGVIVMQRIRQRTVPMYDPFFLLVNALEGELLLFLLFGCLLVFKLLA